MRRHVYYYTHVDAGHDRVAPLLSDDPGLWLPAPAEPTPDGWLVELSARGALPRPLAHHTVLVGVGPPTGESNRTLRSLTWRSATSPGLFPVFDGDIELAGLFGNGCQLSLIGTYRPPLTVAGGAGDALLGHHVAEACVRRFVLDTAASIARSISLPV